MATKAEFVASETGIPLQEIQDALVGCDATTVEEAFAAYQAASEKRAERLAAFQRWDELLLEDLEKVTTCDEARRIYNNSHGQSRTSRKAFEKWVSLCTTVRQAMAAYFVTTSDPELWRERRLVLRKIYDLHVHSSDVGEPPSNPNEGPM